MACLAPCVILVALELVTAEIQRQMIHFLTVVSISLFMLTQYIDSVVFSMPVWLMGSCSCACCYNMAGIIILLFYGYSVSYIIPLSPLKLQYCLISWLTSFLKDSQPSIIYSLHFVQVFFCSHCIPHFSN